ncbi:heavy metal translocating P-type ATPase [Rubrobacter aplysinae]|uniref:heavy metal translocating P-type ATPase n=1 Tax=Rubrobacter aplysinae TaxID=909625 RepID=UPI0022869BA5|nr:cation-translocating P-type ATPase [Rubrobacter aplysinae]
MRVEGMDCASCAVTVERRVGSLSGVSRATVNFAAGRLDAYHDDSVSVERLEQAVRGAGYDVGRSAESEQISFWRTRRFLFTVASALLFALGAVLQLAGAPEIARILPYTAAIMVGGLPIFRAAVSAVRARHLDMNVLMSAAAIGAAGIGAWGEAALVVVLFAAGNALQTFSIDRTRGAVRGLMRLTPDEVLVRREGAERLVPADEVGARELVVVRPGERLAVDGEVLEGRTTVDEAPVTGESVPVEKAAGDEVFSGSLNGSGGIVVRTTREARDSTLQRIARMVEEAQSTRAPAEQFVDRFSRIYTPLVVAAAAAVTVIPTALGGEFGTWFYRGLALLIIACPCSLVISTPVTVVSGIGAASKRGILIKGGAVLEAAGRLKALVFDKTGTLTEGRPVVSNVQATAGMGRDEALRIAGALERRSEHPLAHAILSAAGDGGLPEVSGFTTTSGRGAEGEIGGRRYLIGSPRLFAEEGISLKEASEALTRVENAGETPVILGDEDGPLAVFGLSDAIRSDTLEALQTLRSAGLEELVMLTGDSEAPAKRVASELGLDYRASLLPDQKVAAVRELVTRNGATGMVGDGINDAPALATSSVGFAMGTAGTDVALETADIALMQDDLRKLAAAVRLSRSAERIIKQNILISILIKGVFVLLAPFGLVTLWLAVLADMGTSLAVTLNGLRLFGADLTEGTTSSETTRTDTNKRNP